MGSSPADTSNSFTPAFKPSADRAQPDLITAVVVAADGGTVLMVAHMDAAALSATRSTGVAHFWSRSQGKIWRKGETSGNELAVERILVDCDQDAIVLEVHMRGDGVACHTGARSCFYRAVRLTHQSTAGDNEAPATAMAEDADELIWLTRK